MKALKVIGIVILVIIVIPLIIALFIPKEGTIEVNKNINAPIDSVWQHTNSIANIAKWSPWEKMDPNMKTEKGGIDGEIGAWQSWESDDPQVGSGKQTIVNIESPNLFESYFEFYSPFGTIESDGYIKLIQTSDSTTNIIWGIKSVVPYPFNIMNLMYDQETVEAQFLGGLDELKKLSEKMMEK